MSEEPRILLADAHEPSRLGMRSVLEAEGFVICAEARDVSTAVAAALEWRPDVCLLEFDIPGGGINAARRINVEVPETAVVMLASTDDGDDLFEALRAGARGYLLKDADPNHLAQSLRGVLSGEAALSRRLMARVVAEFHRRQQRTDLPALRRRGIEFTEREWTVLEMMRDGLSTAEMAGRLSVAPVTVRSHVSAILKRLDVRSRSAAVAMLAEEA